MTDAARTVAHNVAHLEFHAHACDKFAVAPRRSKAEMHMRPIRNALMAALLAGCSPQILEDVGEVALTPPRPCVETVKLFNTFSMRARSISWKGSKGSAPATLTLDLTFYNDRNFPIALSNSGNGVHYAVRFNLQGKDGPIAPKEASGVALAREGKTFREPRSPGPFGEAQKRGSSRRAANTASANQTQDTDFRIRPGEPQDGRLVFQLPRDNYLLTIERKFADKPSTKQPSDLLAVCKIPENDVAVQHPPGVSGVY